MKSFSHSFRHIRSLLRQRVEGISFLTASTRTYKPCFSDDHVLNRLGRSSVEPQASMKKNELAFAGARHARLLFGPRFFVSPNDIEELWQQIDARLPKWQRSLTKLIKADANDGIRIYALAGPKFDADFSWSALPVGPGEDGLYSKRPHRFAFAPRAAMASLFDDIAAKHLDGVLAGWMRLAEEGTDRRCYGTNLLVIQRILALSWCWAFLAARPAQESRTGLGLEWRVLKIIAADVRFLEPQLGDSVPNNHLLADWFAGWYLRTIVPEFLDTAETGDESKWCDEFLVQTYPDGGSFEHSAHYHEFACEMGAAYLLLCARNDIEPDARLITRIEALLEFQLALTGPEAIPMPIGNAVEDTLFPLDAGEAWCPGSLRELYRALFNPGTPSTPSDDISIGRAFWLLGGNLAPEAQPEDSGRKHDRGAFFDTGWHIQTDPAIDTRLYFRTGPAPAVLIAAGHMHADLLAIYLRIHGQPMLVDAGTYTYRHHATGWRTNSPRWRAYFAGPRSHNTFTIGDVDPLGPLQGDFRGRENSTRVHSTRESMEGLDLIEAWLDSDSVYRNTRRTSIHIAGEYWLILDTPPVSIGPDMDCGYSFQFPSDADVTSAHRQVHAISANGKAQLYISGTPSLDEPRLYCGSIEPIGGWISPSYGELRAAPQIRFGLGAARRPPAFLLSVTEDHAGAIVDELDLASGGGRLLHVRTGQADDFIMVGAPEGKTSTFDINGLSFVGRLLWIRLVDGRPHALRWLNARHVSWPYHSIDIETSIDENLMVAGGEKALHENATEQSFVRMEWPGASPA